MFIYDHDPIECDNEMKFKKIRKEILEISQAHSSLQNKLQSLSVRNSSDDEIHRIIRQFFTRSKAENHRFHLSHSTSDARTVTSAFILESELLELPTFHSFKNSETQSSPTPCSASIGNSRAIKLCHEFETCQKGNCEHVTIVSNDLSKKSRKSSMVPLKKHTKSILGNTEVNVIAKSNCSKLNNAKAIFIPKHNYGKSENNDKMNGERTEDTHFVNERPEYRVLNATSKELLRGEQERKSPSSEIKKLNKNVSKFISIPKHISIKDGKRCWSTTQLSRKNNSSRSSNMSASTDNRLIVDSCHGLTVSGDEKKSLPGSCNISKTHETTTAEQHGDHSSLVPIVSQEAPYHQFDFQIPKTSNVEITSQLFHGPISDAEFSVMIDDFNDIINDKFTEISRAKKNKG